ncbi:MAG: DUF4810 domain-containing protein [Calditrichaceae bacterium]|nr:DUF4810 domain-containing protein [Calditrichaceae bacterium]MBN2709791.1 DUF4810 domain-containing protein [Calditrichaceae bacterium]RQV94985.1 MAG: DUF4810 domain-containing protein [Calditrichota bacterium]
MKKFLLFLLLIFLLSCTPTKGIYYWGDYSSSLYKLKKEPSDETLLKHKMELENIFKNAQKKRKKIPPGLYCEYAYILIQQGQKDDGLRYFALEVEKYPESKIFIDRIIQQIQTQE